MLTCLKKATRLIALVPLAFVLMPQETTAGNNTSVSSLTQPMQEYRVFNFDASYSVSVFGELHTPPSHGLSRGPIPISGAELMLVRFDEPVGTGVVLEEIAMPIPISNFQELAMYSTVVPSFVQVGKL